MKPMKHVRMQMCSQNSIYQNMCRSSPKSRGQNVANDLRLPLDDNRIAKMIERIVRDGPLDQSLKDVNKDPFTANI